MSRTITRALAGLWVVLFVAGGVGFAPRALAEEPKKKPKPITIASDEEAAAALATFKEAWKAKGLKGDDKISQRDYAMRAIASIQHPEIVKALGKATRSSDPDLRMIALIYLGDQKLHPALAGEYVVKALRKHKKDVVLVMTALQTLGELRYLGARRDLRECIKHRYFVIRKSAIAAVGRIGDKRMLADVLGALGMKLGEDGKVSDKESGGKEVVEEGYSWEGAEATVDRGEADNSKENADAKAQAEAQIAKNKAAAAAGKGGGGGGGASLGGGGGRGGSSRSTQELVPTILRTLKALTGEEFDKPSSIRTWLEKHREKHLEDCKALDEQEKKQAAAR